MVLSIIKDKYRLKITQNGNHFADDIFKFIYLIGISSILIKISLKLFPEVPINNNPTFVQMMALHRIGYKPLSVPMMTWFDDTYMCDSASMS